MLTPYLGVCVSSTVNLGFSRYKDLTDGIEIIDPKTGEKMPHLKSQKCGMKGFVESLFVRWFLPIPAMLFPPLAGAFLNSRMALYRTNKKFGFGVDVFICYVSLVFGVNIALSIFHPLGSIRYCDLEQEIQKQLTDIEDKELLIKFNKGL